MEVFIAVWIALSLSTLNETHYGPPWFNISNRTRDSQIDSFVAENMEMYSASHDDSATHVYFLYLQLTAPPQSVNL